MANKNLSTTPISSVLFNMIRDINGYNGFGLPFCFDTFTATLAANTAETITVPSKYNYWLMICSYQDGSTVWVSNGHTAAVPAGGSFASSTSQLKPVARLVYQGDVVSFITSDTTADVEVSFYGLQLDF